MSLPFFLLPLTLWGPLLNQFPDERADRQGGGRHLAIALGRRAAAKVSLRRGAARAATALTASGTGGQHGLEPGHQRPPGRRVAALVAVPFPFPVQTVLAKEIVQVARGNAAAPGKLRQVAAHQLQRLPQVTLLEGGNHPLLLLVEG